jgi:uncharacterized membrane protein YfcA
MFDSLETLALLCAAALAAGAVNALAGGGTLLTFSALLIVLAPLGAEAGVVANGTSTVAPVPGSLGGAWGYRRQMANTRRWLLLLVGPSLLGGGIGTLLVTRLPPEYFDNLVPWLLLTAAVLFTAQSFAGKTHDADRPPPRPTKGAIVALLFFQLAVAIYGGYFGAGIGILMLASLAIMGVGNVHQANALKTVLASCINGVSVVVFVVDGKVDWRYAPPMALAAIIGGYLGAHGSQLLRPRSVRWIIVGIAFGLTVFMFLHRA